MTAEEIRKQAALNAERSEFANTFTVNWLAEIAAQLAELNASMLRIADAWGKSQ